MRRTTKFCHCRSELPRLFRCCSHATFFCFLLGGVQLQVVWRLFAQHSFDRCFSQTFLFHCIPNFALPFIHAGPSGTGGLSRLKNGHEDTLSSTQTGNIRRGQHRRRHRHHQGAKTSASLTSVRYGCRSTTAGNGDVLTVYCSVPVCMKTSNRHETMYCRYIISSRRIHTEESVAPIGLFTLANNP